MLKLYVGYVGLKHRVGQSFRRLAGDQSGATAIEYGLIAALIAVVI
ncbi:MAG: Flp family type IVb pilin, partial [Rhodospirillales bacterium]|nr:Flp family type IVb pilin [Rhodospirillales bacterium]